MGFLADLGWEPSDQTDAQLVDARRNLVDQLRRSRVELAAAESRVDLLTQLVDQLADAASEVDAEQARRRCS